MREARKSMRIRTQRYGTLLALFILIWNLPAFSQTSAGVTGTVTDDSGGRVSGVTVIITNIETTLQRETVSDDSGFYQFPIVQPGSYTMTAKKAGFRQVAREGLRLEVNQRASVDFTMQVGAITETVEVKAAVPLLEAGTSSVGQVIESKAVSDLPL